MLPALIVLGGFWWFAKERATAAASHDVADGDRRGSFLDVSNSDVVEVTLKRDAWEAARRACRAHPDESRMIGERSEEYWALAKEVTYTENAYRDALFRFGSYL
jgi:hypothetical protein